MQVHRQIGTKKLFALKHIQNPSGVPGEATFWYAPLMYVRRRIFSTELIETPGVFPQPLPQSLAKLIMEVVDVKLPTNPSDPATSHPGPKQTEVE